VTKLYLHESPPFKPTLRVQTVLRFARFGLRLLAAGLATTEFFSVRRHNLPLLVLPQSPEYSSHKK
jgi:hypothetical protein